jgi:hypothetical protein
MAIWLLQLNDNIYIPFNCWNELLEIIVVGLENLNLEVIIFRFKFSNIDKNGLFI